jgi:hypothetical protein
MVTFLKIVPFLIVLSASVNKYLAASYDYRTLAGYKFFGTRLIPIP